VAENCPIGFKGFCSVESVELMLTEAFQVAAAYIFTGRYVRRPHDVAQERLAGRRRCQANFLWMDRQAVDRQLLDDLAADLVQRFRCFTQNHHVIHVADVFLDAQGLFDPVIEVVQENVCEQLAGQISDRHTFGSEASPER
jgi:hypothetical protein